MYGLFLERMGKLHKPEKIKGQPVHSLQQTPVYLNRSTDGKFGAMMNVSLINEVHDEHSFLERGDSLLK
jgi:hypothetical protein